MPIINLKTAVSMIYQIIDQRHKRSQKTPFFFIVGAGVSNPPIPLAREIEEHCKQLALSYDDTNPPELKTTMDSYSHWMGKAYPSPEELQTYLRGLMENKPISKANLRLAHLLLDGRLAHTVFTPNFDDMLPKALELFGQRPLVCDHPLTVGRIRIESEDIQVIHVHGSYWFYDCCNLRHEISERSEYGPVSVLLDQSLRDHSPVVIGYSGWDRDILMSALQRRLSSGKLGTPAFWFCYERESLANLPTWLTPSNDIYFVLPDDPVPAAASPSTAESSGPKSQDSPRTGSVAGAGDSSFDAKTPTLPASRVFDALVLKFQPSTPQLTQNPLAFYADHLKRLLGTTDPEGELDIYYGFHKVIARVERARDSDATEEPDLLQGFRDAMSKADYRSAIKSASEIDFDILPPKEHSELVSALLDACLGLSDNSDEEICGYDLIVRIGDLIAREGQADARTQEQIARALFLKGLTLGIQSRSEEAIAVYDDILSRFADAKESVFRELVAKSLFHKGIRLGILGRNQEAIAICDDVVSRLTDSNEPSLQEYVAMALVNKGARLGNLNRNEEAIATYDDVVNRFAVMKEPTLQEQVAKALINKGVTLSQLNRSDEEIAVYDDVVSRFADAKEPALQRQVTKALIFRGMTCEFLEKRELAIKSYEEAILRFTGSSDTEIEDLVKQTRVRLDALRGGGAESE